MTRVLVSAALESFFRREAVPAEVDVHLLPEDAPLPAGEWAGALPILRRRFGAAEFDRLPALRIVANCAVGFDNVDVAEATRRGIWVTNTPEVLTEATAELTWALILATARRLGEGERLVRSGGWTGWEPTQLLGMGLAGGTLGVVGAGRIGREVARRALAFDMRVVYWDRERLLGWEAESGAEWRDLDELLSEADVVTLHLPMSAGTARLIDAPALARMKPGAILVNTARGGLVDEDALVAALENRRIRGAGLDVYAAEPHVPERLRALENVVLLPHLGSATDATRQAMFDLAWRNLLRGIRGEPLLTPVNRP
jgi:glyoxylate reductase